MIIKKKREKNLFFELFELGKQTDRFTTKSCILWIRFVEQKKKNKKKSELESPNGQAHWQ